MGHIIWPPFPGYTIATGLGTTSLTAIDASGEVCAFVVKAPKTGNIRSVWFHPTVNTGGTFTVGIYQVDNTTGNPANTPTPWATDTFVSKALVTGDSNDTVNSGDFTADAAVTVGQTLAVCFIAGSPGNIQLRGFADAQGNFPYTDLFTGGSWVKNPVMPIVGLVYSDGTIEIPHGCMLSGIADGNGIINSGSFATNTTPDLCALRFQVPWFFQVDGIATISDLDGPINLKIVTSDWDETSNGLLASGTSDPDERSTASTGLQLNTLDSPIVLPPRRWFRAVLEPTSTTGSALFYLPMLDEATLAAQPGGIYAHMSTGKTVSGDGSWTNYNNVTDGFRVPIIYLVGSFLPAPTRRVDGGLAR